MPFLPTIATAVVIAAVSFLCQQTTVAPAPTAQAAIEATSFAEASVATVDIVPPRPSAALAFAQFHPLTFQAPEPKMATRGAPHLAVLPPRRPCPGSRCGETAAIPRRANPFAAAKIMEAERVGTASEEVDQSDGPSLPGIALPFAPVVRVVGEATGIMRSGASALGSSAMMLVDRMR